MCIIDIFEKYQTSIVGFLGFAGVIFTIIMNARLARKQHERELSLESAAIRAALVAELTLLRDTYKDRIGMLNYEKCDGSVLIPEHVSDKVYSQLIPRIGLLTPNEVELIMTAYQLAGELPVRLNLMTEGYCDAPVRSGYIEIDRSNILNAAQLHKIFLEKISSALSAVQQNVHN